MLNKKTRVAVIGEGISALSLLERLGRDKELRSQVELLWIAAPKKAPGCSLRSTALVTDHGIGSFSQGSAPELFRALKMTLDWPFLKQAPGLYWTKHWAIDDGSDEFLDRYGAGHPSREHFLFQRPLRAREAPALLIEVESFLGSLKKRVEALWQSGPLNELVLDYERPTLLTQKQKHRVDYVFWCTGAGVLRPQSFIKHPKASRLKRVEGFTYHYKVPQWRDETFAFTASQTNLISRAGEVFLGGTTQNQTARIPDANSLAEQFQELERLGLDLSVLKAQRPQLWGGPRQKGRKRQFLIGPLNQNEFAILGTYKNGYTLGQLGAFEAHSWLSQKIY